MEVRLFVEKCQKGLFKYLMSNAARFGIACEDDAYDIIGEAFVVWLEKANGMPDMKAAIEQYGYAYIMKICYNLALKHSTSWHTNKRDNLYARTPDGEMSAEISSEVEEQVSGDNELFEWKREQMELITTYIAERLSPKQQAMIWAFYDDKLSMAEIAAKFGLRDASVAKAEKCRIMKKLRTALKKCSD